jgi:hypothetical protein
MCVWYPEPFWTYWKVSPRHLALNLQVMGPIWAQN